MSRIRTIKPEFFRHEALFEAEKETGMPLRVAFAGLWTAADREGRFKWRPRQLKLDVLPFDEVDFERVLDELASRGFIVKYSAGNVALGCIPSWKSHQVINNRESASALPAPSDDACLTREPRVPDASATREPRHQHATSTPLEHAQAEGEGEGKEEEKSSASSSSAVPTGGQPLQVAPCQYEQVLALFNEVLPELPRAKLLTDDRRKGISKRWKWALTTNKQDGTRRATNSNEALSWFRDYFTEARENDFLMGRTPRSEGHANWQCDIDFLLSDKGLKQVIEKTREAA